MVEGRILAENLSMQGAFKIVAPKRGVSRHPARPWTQAARRERRVVQTQPEDLVAEVAKLRRENQKLRDTNELCKVSSTFRLGPQPATSAMIQFIDEYRDRCDVEFICKTLNTQ